MKFTEFSQDVRNISKLPDRPSLENGYTSDMLKELFDKAGEDIKNYINSILLTELTSKDDGYSGADRIGTGPIDILEGESVQEKLENIAGHIKGLANGTLPDGSVSPEKFSPDIAEFLTSASIRGRVFTGGGEKSFTVERDGVYKITMVGGGAGGAQDPNDSLSPCGGGSGAAVILWRELKKDDVCTFQVGFGGKGLYTENGNVIQATVGGDTVFYINSVQVAKAGGGTRGLKARAVAEGGDINIRGSFPKIGNVNGFASSTPAFSLGADSIFGQGSYSSSDLPAIGAGGYGSRYISSNVYNNGGDGADGAVIIEYLK